VAVINPKAPGLEPELVFLQKSKRIHHFLLQQAKRQLPTSMFMITAMILPKKMCKGRLYSVRPRELSVWKPPSPPRPSPNPTSQSALPARTPKLHRISRSPLPSRSSIYTARVTQLFISAICPSISNAMPCVCQYYAAKLLSRL